ncbi:galactose oxidase [Cystobasidium minutum MCA 4210]|uniref:galactose oxidase n=1 Tax=Cystobasidium minutum MCA 4210 TaxID=1397322 RepID=UPI0034CFB0A5|eukprot:jgi/Rhomi1/149931/estExt_Genewise1.C_2_t20141
MTGHDGSQVPSTGSAEQRQSQQYSSPPSARLAPSTHKTRSSRQVSAPAAANTLADLTSCVRRTTGDVPPGLVGFSSTTIGDKLYIFGGRLVHVRRMVNELRALDLNTLVWEKLWPLDGVSESAGPQPRYFHSADAWGSKLVIFGGMGQSADSESQGSSANGDGSSSLDPNLSVLSDLLIYDTLTREWTTPDTKVREGVEPPLPRYAHLSATSNGCLVILGGQDVLNQYIEQMCCLELESMTYVQSSEWKGHAGTYRSVAVSRQLSVHPGGANRRNRGEAFEDRMNRMSMSNDDSEYAPSTEVHSQADENLQLPYTTPATSDEPIYTYTNYNFADVQRALDMISPPSTPDWTSSICPLSEYMTGTPSLPPGLRFPTAAMVGTHLVLTGTLITQQVSSFAIWTLDLSKAVTPEDVLKRPSLAWQRIDAGHALRSGSWNRAVAWKNSVVILGDRDRDIAIDYNRRQNNFTHVVYVDLETFGIYNPPPRIPPLATQEFALSILNQPLLADFDLVCTDGVRLPCSRGILEAQWLWFKEKLDAFKRSTTASLKQAYEELEESTVASESSHTGTDPDATVVNGSLKVKNVNNERTLQISPQELVLAENSEVGTAILHYFYTLNLITPLQHSPTILVSLLLFAKNYDLIHLRALCTHALHVRLAAGQASPATVYEAAALGGCLALQTRALKMMMSANSKLKLRPGGSVVRR